MDQLGLVPVNLTDKYNFLNMVLMPWMIIGPMIMIYAGIMLFDKKEKNDFNYYGNIGSNLGGILITVMVLK